MLQTQSTTATASASAIAGPHASERKSARGTAEVRCWRPDAGRDLNVICALSTRRRIPLHVRQEFEILIPPKGVRVVHGCDTAVAPPGSLVITPPLVAHGMESAEAGESRMLFVPPEVFARIWEDLSGRRHEEPPRFNGPVVIDAQLARELTAVFDAMRQPDDTTETMLRLLRALAQLIIRHGLRETGAGARARCSSGTTRVRGYLESHVLEDVTLDYLAGVANLSKWYLLRAFQQEFGLTPHAYQMELRLARARHLLASGVSSAMAAYQAGFADQSHLTRRLKASLGITPGAFARQLSAPAIATVTATPSSPATPLAA